MDDFSKNFDRPTELADSFLSLPFRAGGILCAVALFLIYGLLGHWSYHFVFSPVPTSVFWLPSGLTVFLMVFFRQSMRLWPFFIAGLFFGELFLVTQNNIPLFPAIFWSIANIALALTTGLLSRKMLGDTFRFTRVRDVFRFFIMVAIAVIPGALISALGTKFGLGVKYWWSVLEWSLSDALGIILC
ncbi:MAG: MASE1 domain-containing protein, partial [Bacteriovoracaceae bacterium]